MIAVIFEADPHTDQHQEYLNAAARCCARSSHINFSGWSKPKS
jgi:hypothetical protein